MTFEVIPTHKICEGKVKYNAEEYTFDFEPRPPGGGASLLINDLQLEIDYHGVVLYTWGLCPYQQWEGTTWSPPAARRGGLRILLDEETIPGVSYRLTKPGAWPVFVNAEQSWVCIGTPQPLEPYNAVEYASNSIAVLQGGTLQAIWLHPKGLTLR